jgi:hypothetical protein
MDLLISVFITDINTGVRVSKKGERLDVFKYSLASYSVLPLNKVFIFCKLDDNYRCFQEDLEIYIKSIFKDPIIHFDRFVTQKQWKDYDIFNKLESDLIWFNQNDDHVFIDSNLDMINEGIKLLNEDSATYKSLFYTIFSEQVAFAKRQNCIKFGNYLRHKTPFVDSTQIFNKNFLKYLIYDLDWKGQENTRIDSLILDKRAFGEKYIRGSCEIILCDIDVSSYIPLKELCRHYESYHHSKSPFSICPPLFIPYGFFENEIIIKYCNKTYDGKYVNIHPFKKFRINNKFGYTNKNELHLLTDMNCLLQDIPLFWASHIKKIIIDEHIDEKILKDKRNENFYEVMNMPLVTALTDNKIMSKDNNNYPEDWFILGR